jgi:hypothetical protein
MPKIAAAASQLNATPRFVTGASGINHLITQGPAGEYWRDHLLIASTGTDWEDRSTPGQAALLDAIEKYAPDQGPEGSVSLGFANGYVVASVLEKAIEDGDLSRAGIVAAMRELDQVSTGDLTADVQAGPAADRVPPLASSISVVDPTTVSGFRRLAAGYQAESAEQYPFD